MHQIENFRLAVQNLAKRLVLLAIIAYSLVVGLIVGPPKIENRFAFNADRCPP